MNIKSLYSISRETHVNRVTDVVPVKGDIIPAGISEGKIEQIISPTKVIVSLNGKKFPASIDVDVVEGETILFKAIKNQEQTYLKILDSNYTKNLNQVTDIRNSIKENFVEIFNFLKEPEFNFLFNKLLLEKNQIPNIKTTIEEEFREQLIFFMKKYLKDQGSLIESIFDSIFSLSSVKNYKTSSKNNEKIQKLLSYFFSIKLHNQLSNRADQPFLSWYFPFYTDRGRNDIFINIFAKKFIKNKKNKGGFNAQVGFKLSNNRFISFLINLNGKNISCYIYSSDKKFLNLLENNKKLLTRKINSLGFFSEILCFNSQGESALFFKDNIFIKSDKFSINESI
ncbi:MAG: hypothetical protein HZA77_05175 [Candidatus Schekmanbacteria bacterium]|nr:hypothetical protein [Candidatus Schekmanbacteria bacterium]